MRVNEVIESKGSSAVYTIEPTATVAALLDTLAEHNVGALVVSSDGQTIEGIVSERDVVRKLRGAENPRELEVASIMTTDVRTCAPDDALTSMLTLMTDHRIRHVPIVEDGALVGVLSIGDAVKFRMAQLEFERDQLDSYVHQQ